MTYFHDTTPWGRILAILAFGLVVLAGTPVNARNPLPSLTISSSTPLTPYLDYLLDEGGVLDVEEAAAPEKAREYKPLAGPLPDTQAVVWLRFTLPARGGNDKSPTLLLDMGESVPDDPILYEPLFNNLSSSLEWREMRPSQRNVQLLPEPGPEPKDCYIRLDGLPGPWFAPMLRTPQNAATSWGNLSRSAALLALGVVMLLCLLRSLSEKGQWRVWTALYVAVALGQGLLGMPATGSGHMAFASLPHVLAPGVALMLLPHVGRHLMRTRSTSRALDVQLVLLSLPGAALALLPLVPGYSWIIRYLDLWPFCTLVFVPTALGAWIMGVGGARRFLLACLIQPLAVAAGVMGLKMGLAPNLLASAPLWGTVLSALLVAGTRAPHAPHDADDAEPVANEVKTSHDGAIILENPLDDPNLRLIPPSTAESAVADTSGNGPAVTADDISAAFWEASLRQPLDRLMRDSAVLRQSALPTSVRNHVESMIGAAEEMAGIISNPARAQASGNQADGPAPFNLQHLMREVHDRIAPQAESMGIALAWYMPPQLGQNFEGPGRTLAEVLDQLLESALRATSSGAVQFSVRRVPESPSAGHLLFTVTDTGTGLPPKERSSLALARAWEFAGANSGYLGLESGPHGVTIAFTIRITSLDEQDSPVDEAESADDAGHPAATHGVPDLFGNDFGSPAMPRGGLTAVPNLMDLAQSLGNGLPVPDTAPTDQPDGGEETVLLPTLNDEPGQQEQGEAASEDDTGKETDDADLASAPEDEASHGSPSESEVEGDAEAQDEERIDGGDDAGADLDGDSPAEADGVGDAGGEDAPQEPDAQPDGDVLDNGDDDPVPAEVALAGEADEAVSEVVSAESVDAAEEDFEAGPVDAEAEAETGDASGDGSADSAPEDVAADQAESAVPDAAADGSVHGDAEFATPEESAEAVDEAVASPAPAPAPMPASAVPHPARTFASNYASPAVATPGEWVGEPKPIGSQHVHNEPVQETPRPQLHPHGGIPFGAEPGEAMPSRVEELDMTTGVELANEWVGEPKPMRTQVASSAPAGQASPIPPMAPPVSRPIAVPAPASASADTNASHGLVLEWPGPVTDGRQAKAEAAESTANAFNDDSPFMDFIAGLAPGQEPAPAPQVSAQASPAPLADDLLPDIQPPTQPQVSLPQMDEPQASPDEASPEGDDSGPAEAEQKLPPALSQSLRQTESAIHKILSQFGKPTKVAPEPAPSVASEPAPVQEEKHSGPAIKDAALRQMVERLDQSLAEAQKAYKEKQCFVVASAAGRIAMESSAFGLRSLVRMARCVESAAKANDLNALNDLLPELAVAVERNRIALTQ